MGYAKIKTITLKQQFNCEKQIRLREEHFYVKWTILSKAFQNFPENKNIIFPRDRFFFVKFINFLQVFTRMFFLVHNFDQE